ncbi:hypothetical protein [Pseudomonas fluorescens]|uniref:hypothetical protein n=1 Tax=Pseudomonas fluorescens TaxID=294 RepID=UPI001CD7D0B5|nr:hypothetical protein [Pseudomonas fluorescens]
MIYWLPALPLFYKADGIRVGTNQSGYLGAGDYLNHSSGFTQGQVGFSGEIAGFNTIALVRDRAAVAGPNNRPLADSDGDVLGNGASWVSPILRRVFPTPR